MRQEGGWARLLGVEHAAVDVELEFHLVDHCVLDANGVVVAAVPWVRTPAPS